MKMLLFSFLSVKYYYINNLKIYKIDNLDVSSKTYAWLIQHKYVFRSFPI